MTDGRPLIEQLLDDQALRWGHGDRPLVEEYFLAHPDLSADANSVLDLINHEVLLRQDRGEPVRLDEYLARFPHLAGSLKGMFEVHAVLEAEPASAVQPRGPRTLAGATLSGSAALRGSASALPEVPGYKIIEELGRGGMGVVYLAWQAWPNRMVALKMIRAELAADPRELARFRTEAEAVALLEHPNIVRLHEVGSLDGRPFFSLEYIQGGTLAQAFRGIPQPPRESAALLETLARAVHYAHRRGVLHRDLKPANILIADCKPSANPQSAIRNPQSDESAIRNPQSAMRITDFGLARLVAGSDGPTVTGDVFGTPSYMAPEQAEGRARDIGPATDVYALGAILYEALTGRPPFIGASPVEILLQVKLGDVVPPSSIQSDVPRELATICLKCLRREPAQRYHSAEEMADDLHRYLDGKPVRARPESGWRRAVKWAQRRPALASLLAGTVAVLLLGFPLVSWQWYQTRQAWQAEHEQFLQKEQAERSEAEQRRRFQSLSARLVRDEALRLCDEGDDSRGLLALVHALQIGPQDDRNLRFALRTNIAAAMRRIHSLKALLSHDSVVLAVAWSRDGKTIATGGSDYKARIWNADTGECRHVLAHDDNVRTVALSPDGSMLLAGTARHGTRLWNTASGERIPSEGLSKESDVTAAAFSADGSQLLTGARSGRVRLWDAATGTLLRTLDGPTLAVRVVAFNPTGKTILAAGDDSAAFLWTAAGNLLGRLMHDRQDRKIGDAAFSPDGKLILTGSYDGTARLWDAVTAVPFTAADPETSLPRSVVLSHVGPITAVALSPDGKRVVLGGANQSAQVWTVRGQRRGQALPHKGGITSVAFSPDGQTVLTGGWDQVARLWDAATGEPLGALLPHQSKLTRVAFLPDGQTLLTLSQDRSVRLWRMTAERSEPLRHGRWVTSVAFSADGQIALTASSDTTVQLWDAVTHVKHGAPLKHPRFVLAAVFSPDGRAIVTGCEDGKARIWDVATGKCLHDTLVHPDRVRAAAVSPDGKKLLTGCENGRIYLWDMATGAPLPTVEKHHTRAIYAVAYAPDGKTFLTGSEDMTAQVWDATTCRPVGPALHHHGTVRSLAYSRDGTILLTGSEDRTARLWSAATREALGTPLVHPGSVLAVAFGSEDRLVLTGCQDKQARLWDRPSGEPVGLPLSHPRPVRAVAFSPDGKIVLTGCEDSKARFWPVPGPVKEDVAVLVLRVQVVVGMERDSLGAVRALDAGDWLRRRERAHPSRARSEAQ